MMMPSITEQQAFLQDGYDALAADVWSLGIMAFVLVCGRLPFRAAAAYSRTFRSFVHATQPHALGDAVMCPHSDLWRDDARAAHQARQRGERCPLQWSWPPHLSPSFVELVSACLRVRADERPSMAELKSFAWFTQPLQAAAPHVLSVATPQTAAVPAGLSKGPEAILHSKSTATEGSSPMPSPMSAAACGLAVISVPSAASTFGSNAAVEQHTNSTTSSLKHNSTAVTVTVSAAGLPQGGREPCAGLHEAPQAPAQSFLPALHPTHRSTTTAVAVAGGKRAAAGCDRPPGSMLGIRAPRAAEDEGGGVGSPLPRLVGSERTVAPSSPLRRSAPGRGGVLASSPAPLSALQWDDDAVATTTSLLATVVAAAHGTDTESMVFTSHMGTLGMSALEVVCEAPGIGSW